MKVVKVLNNNSLIAVDPDQNESILIGKGLAFGKKTGDLIDEKLIGKKFVLDKANDKAEAKKLIQLIQEIPLETLKIGYRIVEYAREKLNRPISQNIEISITDHIHYALTRIKRGIVFENYFLWEMKRFYPDEYTAALEAIHVVNKRYDANLPDSEASFIALHIVKESFEGGNMQEVLSSTKLIHNILNIVQYHFNLELQCETLSYQRFITHLKFFTGRILSGKMLGDREYYLYDFMRLKYEDVFQCAMKIDALVKNETGKPVSQEELAYLMVHIERVLHQDRQ